MAEFFDQIAKRLFTLVLEPYGKTQAQEPVAADLQHIDIRYTPDPEKLKKQSKDSLIRRMAEEPCIIEPFHEAVGLKAYKNSLRKQLNHHHQLELKAKSHRNKRLLDGLPRMWIISAGLPKTLLEQGDFKKLKGWPKGFYETTPLLMTRLIVVPQLEEVPQTLYFRLLGKQMRLQKAFEELKEAPEHSFEKDVVLSGLIQWIVQLSPDEDQLQSEEERAYMVVVKSILEETRAQGREEGRALVVRVLLRSLARQGFTVSSETEQKIKACQDLDQLERWCDRVAEAKTIEDVFAS